MNVVLEGVGVKGMAYDKVIKCLDEVDIMQQLRRFQTRMQKRWAPCHLWRGKQELPLQTQQAQLTGFRSIEIEMLFAYH